VLFLKDRPRFRPLMLVKVIGPDFFLPFDVLFLSTFVPGVSCFAFKADGLLCAYPFFFSVLQIRGFFSFFSPVPPSTASQAVRSDRAYTPLFPLCRHGTTLSIPSSCSTPAVFLVCCVYSTYPPPSSNPDSLDVHFPNGRNFGHVCAPRVGIQ